MPSYYLSPFHLKKKANPFIRKVACFWPETMDSVQNIIHVYFQIPQM